MFGLLLVGVIGLNGLNLTAARADTPENTLPRESSQIVDLEACGCAQLDAAGPSVAHASMVFDLTNEDVGKATDLWAVLRLDYTLAIEGSGTAFLRAAINGKPTQQIKVSSIGEGGYELQQLTYAAGVREQGLGPFRHSASNYAAEGLLKPQGNTVEIWVSASDLNGRVAVSLDERTSGVFLTEQGPYQMRIQGNGQATRAPSGEMQIPLTLVNEGPGPAHAVSVTLTQGADSAPLATTAVDEVTDKSDFELIVPASAVTPALEQGRVEVQFRGLEPFASGQATIDIGPAGPSEASARSSAGDSTSWRIGLAILGITGLGALVVTRRRQGTPAE